NLRDVTKESLSLPTRRSTDLFRDAADLIAMKFMTRYLVWIFYGIGRCDATIEYSWVLVKHYADERQVGFYIFRLVVNSLVLRARSEEHTSELQSRFDLVCRLL